MNHDRKWDLLKKIIVIGSSMSGKTSIVNRYTDHTFSSDFISTIGLDFKIKTVTMAARNGFAFPHPFPSICASLLVPTEPQLICNTLPSTRLATRGKISSQTDQALLHYSFGHPEPGAGTSLATSPDVGALGIGRDVDPYSQPDASPSKLLKVKLQIWDTAGQCRFQTLCRAYYRNANGCLFVCDVADRKSFVEVRKWIQEFFLQLHCEPGFSETTKPNVVSAESTKIPTTRLKKEKIGCACIIVANKIDHINRQVSKEELEALGKEFNFPIIETSAKENIGIELLFSSLVAAMLEKQDSSLLYATPHPEAVYNPARYAVDPSHLQLLPETKEQQRPPSCAC